MLLLLLPPPPRLWSAWSASVLAARSVARDRTTACGSVGGFRAAASVTNARAVRSAASSRHQYTERVV
jgi:hypothetical protein